MKAVVEEPQLGEGLVVSPSPTQGGRWIITAQAETNLGRSDASVQKSEEHAWHNGAKINTLQGFFAAANNT